MSGPLTDFSRYGHEELVRMVHAGRPEAIREAGDLWHDVGQQLHDRASELDTHLSRFAPMWDGAAAEQYGLMVTDLSKGLRSVADVALSCRNVVLGAGEALASAQSRMPAPVAVSPVDPTVAALADGSLPVSTAAALWEAAGPSGRSALTRQVQAAQQQMSAAGAAHADAVAVMTQLAAEYVHARETVPVTPEAATPPPVSAADRSNPATQVLLGPDQPGVTTPVLAVGDSGGSPAGGSTGGGGGRPPLFSTVYSSGLVAAGAAMSAFGSRLGGLLRRNGGAASSKSRTAGTGSTASTGSSVGPIGSGGAGGGVIGAGVGGPATPAAMPTASPELAGANPAGRVADAAVIGAARAASSAGGAGQMGAMPFMPMGGAGDAAAAGGGRRIPPWLVETEDVWGEAVVVTPPVIGEAVPKPGRR